MANKANSLLGCIASRSREKYVSPLLISGEAPSGMLDLVLDCPVQDRDGHTGVGPEQGHEGDWAWSICYMKEAERARTVQPGERERKLRQILVVCINTWWDGDREEVIRLFLEVHKNRTKGKEQFSTQEIPARYKDFFFFFFYHEVDKYWRRA